MPENPKVVLVVDGGIVVEVLADQPVDVLTVDHDIQDEDEIVSLHFPDGDTFDAGLYENSVEVNPTMVKCYYDQIPAA